MEKRKKKWGWLAAGAALALLVIMSIVSRQARKNAPIVVEAAALAPGRVVSTISAPGTIEAADYVELHATSSGFVDKVFVKAGDLVRAGQPLVSLDDRALRSQYETALANVDLAQVGLDQLTAKSPSMKTSAALQLEQAEANLVSARIHLRELQNGASKAVLTQAESAYRQAKLAREQAEKEYQRLGVLYDQGAITKAQLEAAEAKLDAARAQEDVTGQQYEAVKAGPTEAELAAAKAQVKQAETTWELAQIATQSRNGDEKSARARLRSAKAQLDMAKKALDDAVLNAPFDGTVLSIPVQSGGLVGTGQLVATVGRPGGLIARVKVDEVDVVRLKTGMPSSINTDASQEPFKGQVTFVSPQGVTVPGASSGTGSTFEVEITVRTGLDMLRPGMTVDVEIETAASDAAAVVPLQAVIEEETGGQRERFVYVVKDGKASRTSIKLGVSNESIAEVLSGVGPNDLVVTGDYEAFKRLTDGMAVTVKGQAPPKSAAGGSRGRGRRP